MTKITRTFEVGAPPEKVFAAISVPEKWPQWATFVKGASSDGPKAHWVYELGGMKVESDTEVSRISANRLYEFEQKRGFMKSAATRLEIEPSERASTITWTVQYELPYSYLGKLVDKLRARQQFERAIDEAITNLQAFLKRQLRGAYS